jgi:hypothetical protein
MTPSKTNRTKLDSALLDNLAVVFDFLTLQNKYNIRTLTENIKFICTQCEMRQKISNSYK